MSLTQGQKNLLETIKPLNEWGYILNTYDEDSDTAWTWIEEEFWQNGKIITFDDFYYAGKDLTIINNNLDLINNLKKLEMEIKEKIVNSHYHGIARRTILDYQIGDKDYDTTLTFLIQIRDLIYVRKRKQIIRIQQWMKRIIYLKSNRFKVLWKIAEYYIAKKYSPINALKYIDLDD